MTVNEEVYEALVCLHTNILESHGQDEPVLRVLEVAMERFELQADGLHITEVPG